MSVPSTAEIRPGDSATSLGGYLLWTSRPRLWPYLGGPALVGVVWGATDTASLLDPVAVAVVLYFLVPANLVLYGVADRFDAGNPDDGDEAVRYDGGGRVDAAVLTGGLLGLPFVLALPTLGILALLSFFGLALVYSVPPLRMRARPVIDSAANGIYVLPGVVGFAAVAGEVPSSLVVLAGWFWAMGMHTLSTIPEIEADREAGVDTTATLLGEMDARTYVIACWVAAAVAATSHAPILGLAFVVYPGLGGLVAARQLDYERAARWVTWTNAFVGIVLTLAGLSWVTGGL